MKPRRNSTALMFSLSEFSFLLLFIAIGFSGFLYVQYKEAREKNAFLYSEIRTLTREVHFLNEMLEEKKHAVLPCWRRPEGVIPPLVGTITIHSRNFLTIDRTACDTSYTIEGDRTTLPSRVSILLDRLFDGDMCYADDKSCYLRMNIINQTNNFELYRTIVEIVKKNNIVVVQE
ncbi:MAG: hypothetical protein ACLFNZ_10540 [Spirochaetaceae bacterium]